MHLAKPYLFVAILILAAGVGADEVAVPCNKDNTLYQDREGNISNGGGQHLFVGKTLRGPLRRTLLAFDLADRHLAARFLSRQLLGDARRRLCRGRERRLYHRRRRGLYLGIRAGAGSTSHSATSAGSSWATRWTPRRPSASSPGSTPPQADARCCTFPSIATRQRRLSWIRGVP